LREKIWKNTELFPGLSIKPGEYQNALDRFQTA